MNAKMDCAAEPSLIGARARGAARANLAGGFGMVWATFGAPNSVWLTLFLQEFLRADKWVIGLVMTMTFLGPTFEPLGAFLADRWPRRRLFLLTFLLNRIPFLALAVIPFLGPPDACRTLGIALVLAVVAVSRVPAHLGTPAWWSWMADLVPERRRGRFFGWRNQMASTFTAVSFVLGMTLLQTCGGMHNVYLVSALFGVGALFGITDILLYLKVPDPGPKGKYNGEKSQPVAASFLTPFQTPHFRRLILGMGLWSFSANLVLPFLPVFQAGEMVGGQHVGLGLSWLFLAALNVSASIGGMASSRWWAHWGDRLGPQRLLLLGSGYLFVNLAYLLVGPHYRLGWLVPVTLVGGALNAAWTVSANQLLVGVAPRHGRSYFVSAFNFTNGWLMAGGPLLGGLLADRLPLLGWRLPSGVPFCYFHLLLLAAVAGGAAALTILARMPGPAPSMSVDEAYCLFCHRIRLLWIGKRDTATEPAEVDEANEYATI